MSELVLCKAQKHKSEVIKCDKGCDQEELVEN